MTCFLSDLCSFSVASLHDISFALALSNGSMLVDVKMHGVVL